MTVDIDEAGSYILSGSVEDPDITADILTGGPAVSGGTGIGNPAAGNLNMRGNFRNGLSVDHQVCPVRLSAETVDNHSVLNQCFHFRASCFFCPGFSSASRIAS